MKFKEKLGKLFKPAPGSPRWMFVVPYLVLAILILGVGVGGAYGWEYTNSPSFCGATCHTMPPQDVTYKLSPHANVYCTECHIGRAFVGEQLARKSEDVYELVSTVFHLYEYPIRATRTKPDLLTCEKCHQPEAFSSDSLQTITHYLNDTQNTATTTYLILKTGGGAEQEGLGRGIHWHIINPVYYYSPDIENQVIPYVRVMNDDGTYTEYVDLEAGFDLATLDETKLKQMECTTCHNRVSHDFKPPTVSVDEAMSRGLISPDIPTIHEKAVTVLSNTYATRDEAMAAIDALGASYQGSDFYAGHEDQVASAVEYIKTIYDRTFFLDQKIDWTTHPNNIGHVNSPGCFRCHDGKHLDNAQQAIRLECNLCHSIPTVASAQDFVSTIEISHGPEPETHLNPNWITMHRDAFNYTCADCHSMDDPGGTSNTSFCSNSACHGSAYTYAGFDAPALREILKAQLPPPPPPQATPAPVVGTPTFQANILPLFTARCAACHGETDPQKGLNLTEYASIMAGGVDGPVIIAKNSANSKLVQVQGGPHFATFSKEELDYIIQWIDAGALDN